MTGALRFGTGATDRDEEIAALFRRSFGDAEGPDEAALVATLVHDLLRATPAEDVRVFLAYDGGEIRGCIFFSRLRFAGEAGRVLLLSPVAVATDHQGRGIGQALLHHGLAEVAREGAEAVVTYGDPRFYGKLGFAPVSEDVLPPPYPLSQPEGWLALSLSGAPITPLCRPVQPVAGFDNPALW